MSVTPQPNPLTTETEPSANERRIDWPQARALMRAYMYLGTRGPMRQMYGQRAGKHQHIWVGYLMMAAFGSFFGLSAFMAKEPFTWLLMVHTMTFGLVAMTAILESSLILFNPAEEDVLGHRPIGPRTLIVAKTVNLTVTVLLLALSFNLVPTCCLWGMKGVGWWQPLVHLLALVLSCLFCASAVVFVYGLMARMFGRERFQTLVTWIQVVMVLFFSIGYQIIGQMMTRLYGLQLERYGIYFLPLPPAWFAGLEAALGDPRGAPPLFWVMGALGLVLPLVLGWAAVLRLASMQGRLTGALIEQPAPPPVTAVTDGSASTARAERWREGRGWFSTLLRLWLRDPIEREIFHLVTTYLRRDRFIMQQIYPQLGFVVLYPVMMLFIGHGRQEGFMLYFGLWFLSMLAPLCLEILRHSPNPAASELFAVVPLDSPGALFNGARKTVLCCLALPSALGLALIYWLVVPNPLEPLLTGLPLLVLIPTISLWPGVFGRAYLPLAEPPRQGSQGLRFMIAYMISMLLSGAVLGLSFLARQLHFYWALLAVEAPVVALIHYAMLRAIARPRPIRLE